MATIAPALPIALAAATGLIGLWAWLDARIKTAKCGLSMQPTPFNVETVGRCKQIQEQYQPVPFLTNGHVETIFAAKMRSWPENITYTREVLHMPDGGVVSLDWELHEEDMASDAPVLILFPGLTGGSGDTYVQHAVERARKRGIRAVVFNSRGTADSPVTTPQFYSASFTGDTRDVIAHVRRKFPHSTLLAAGWSLGANILVRYLGEEGAGTPLSAAVSMCNPFNLTISNANFEKGFNKIYDWNLASSLKNIFKKHQLVWNGAKGKVRPDLVPGCKTIREFDDYITIHSFGWPSVDEYYAGSSSSLSVPKVTIPLLCIQALDDPIAPKEAIPYDALLANPNCVLVCTPCGGHLGWVSGDGGLFGHPWSDEAMLQWLDSVLVTLGKQAGNGNGSGPGPGSSSASSSGESGEVVVVAAGSPHGSAAPHGWSGAGAEVPRAVALGASSPPGSLASSPFAWGPSAPPTTPHDGCAGPSTRGDEAAIAPLASAPPASAAAAVAAAGASAVSPAPALGGGARDAREGSEFLAATPASAAAAAANAAAVTAMAAAAEQPGGARGRGSRSSSGSGSRDLSPGRLAQLQMDGLRFAL